MKPKIQFNKQLKTWLTSKWFGTQSIPTPQPESINTSEPTLQSDTQFSCTFHHSCKTLLYSTFIQIILNNDLSLLTISGTPSQNVLEGAWDAILMEFSSLINTTKSSTILDCWKRMTINDWKIKYVAMALEFLKKLYSEQIAIQLTELGYDFIAECEDRQDYLRQIYIVENEAKYLIVLNNQLNNEYKLLCPEGAETYERNEMDYEKEIAILSKHVGYRIKKDETTVLEFAAIVNIYIEYNKQMSKDAQPRF